MLAADLSRWMISRLVEQLIRYLSRILISAQRSGKRFAVNTTVPIKSGDA